MDKYLSLIALKHLTNPIKNTIYFLSERSAPVSGADRRKREKKKKRKKVSPFNIKVQSFGAALLVLKGIWYVATNVCFII